MTEIVPSLLSADFADLAGAVAEVEAAGAKRIHFDVMDGHFVPSLTFGAPVLAAIRKRTRLHLEAHLMVSNPQERISDFVDAGADTIIIHAEATDSVHGLLDEIKSFDIKAGVSINPGTSISVVSDLLGEIDLLLIMTVNPGFGGQLMIESALDKIPEAKSMPGGDNPIIEVDGGINTRTAVRAAAAGAQLLVSGSAIFGAPDIERRFSELTRIANST